MSDLHETSPAPGPERPALSGSSIVALRLLLLVAAAAAVLVAGVIALRDRGEGSPGVRYACPMHPEVRTTAPGSCPICQMALEPVGRAPGGKGHAGMAATADMTAVDNIRKHKIIDFVRVRSLLPNLREIRGAARVDDAHELSVILYDDQIAALAPDEPGTFVPTASPAKEIPVTRIAGPPVRWDRSTSMIRFQVGTAAASGGLPAGQVGWLKLASKSRAVVGVPVTAVLQSPEGPYVLAWKASGQFEKRPIEIGETFSRQGFAVVLSGLRPSDRVVSRAAFFLDADRRLNGSAFAADGMPGVMPGTAPGGTP